MTQENVLLEITYKKWQRINRRYGPNKYVNICVSTLSSV